MSWPSLAPAFLLVVAVLYLPGLALAAAVGARRFLLAAVAPAVSVGFMGAAAVVFPRLGLRWEVVPVAVAAAVLAAVLGLVRWATLRRIPPTRFASRRGDGWLIGGSLALGAIIITVQVCLAIGRPDHFSQTFDAAFHLNALRYIAETGDGSSLHITDLILPPGQSTFYPAAWHDFVALGAEAAGVTIPVAVNLSSVAVAALVWPSAGIFLARTLLAGSRVAIIGAGVLSAAVPAFPLLMIDFGVLYPYFLALALLPLALALGIQLVGPRQGFAERPLEPVILLAAVVTAMGLSQPAVVFAWAACMIPPLIARYIGYVRTRRGLGTRLAASIILLGGIVALAVAWIVFGRVGRFAPWTTYTSVPGALGEAISYSVKGTPVALALAFLTVVGLVHLVIHREKLWIAGMWAVGAVLFVTAVSIPSWGVRTLVVGLFYRDPPRLAALLGVLAFPIAVVGLVSLCSALRTRIEPRLPGNLRPLLRLKAPSFGFATVLVLLLVAATQGPAMRVAVASASNSYALTAQAPLVSIDELALLERLDEEVPDGSVIAGNPWTGTSFAYAVSGRHVLNPHFNAVTDLRAGTINTGLDRALTDPEVCRVVRDLHVDYVLDFGTYMRDVGESGVATDVARGYTGLIDLESSDVVRLVDREGPARLYRITACR